MSSPSRAASSSADWVDVQKGLVSRDIFVSDDVYRLEIERIFDRTWVFLAHETEIRNPGDFVCRNLGQAPVVVVRDNDGTIHALLNSCRHRGAKVCRAESGNARHFVCPYHGWTYERSGRLVTTTFDRHFPKDFDFSKQGLAPVPRMEIYNGLIFGSWNPDVRSLAEYLGEIGWYISPFLCRSPQGMEVLAPPHRWHARSNWKVGALNFVGDSQHILTTHVGPLTLDPVRAARAGFATAAENSFQVVTDHGHGCTLTYLAPGLPEDAYQTHPPELEPLYRQILKGDQLQLLNRLRVIVGTIFPNLSFIETQVGPAQKAIIIRQWQPVSGTEMEVLSWVLAEKEASQAYKDTVLRNGFHNFGAAGVFEQDDMELWASATYASNNAISKRFPYSFHTALPYINRPEKDHKWPGRAFKPADTEVTQLEFMRHWDRYMKSNQ
jgi:phenylpropionate dioxygenase-like ring-hydroxylating dioxygenase large terminal subunit